MEPGRAIRCFENMNVASQKGMSELMAPAINELKVSLDTVENNAPINEREGNIGQANLERETATSINAAVARLREKIRTPWSAVGR